jgi:hypothetical protein
MRSRVLTLATAAVVAASGSLLTTVAAQGPAAAPARSAAAGKATPRTPWGDPDIQGLYNTAWLTPFERPTQVARDALSEQEARALEQQAAARRERAARPSDGSREAPPVGGDGSTGAAGNVGGYNNFWIDNGEQYFSINGQRRASIVVDPPEGRVPPLTDEARKRQMARANLVVAPTSDAPENVQTQRVGAYDDPELRPLGERCILGFGSTSGPPMLPVLYNNFKQIVQTPDAVMILVEMNHDARVIRLNKPHAPPTIRKWLGDSVGRWEGDTLVVETTNFTSKTRYRGASENLKVTERFTRLDDNTLLYRFTIDDPSTWTRPWSGEYPFVRAQADDRLYEYACHEGNYAFEGILKGERLLEKEAAETQQRR